MKNIENIRKELENRKTHSAWNLGVNDYAKERCASFPCYGKFRKTRVSATAGSARLHILAY